MSSWLNMFRGIDNNSFDIGRVTWFLGAVAMLGYQGYALFLGQTWNSIEFGGGFAALLAAGGFGIKQKDTGVANAMSVNTPAIQVETAGDINAENVSVGNTTS